MSKGRGTRQQHPLVEAYVSGQHSYDLPWDSVDPSGSAARALAAHKSARRGESSMTEALACYRSADLHAIRPAEAQLIFLRAWLDTSFLDRYHSGTLEEHVCEMEAIIKRMRTIIGPESHPVMRIMLLNSEAALAVARGNSTQNLRLIAEAAEIPPPGSLWHRRVVLHLADDLAQLGHLVEAEPSLQRIAAESGDEDRALIDILRFVDAIEGVRLDEAASRLEPVVNSDVYKSNKLVIEPYRLLGDYLRIRWTPGRSAPPPPADPPLQNWAQVMDHLMAGRTEPALSIARKMAAERPDADILRHSPDAWNLLRAELACRNGEAARRIMARRREVGNTHHLDGFFMARIELLAGDREAAARHFAAATAACERYRSLGRLDLELRMACELSAADACWLGRASAGAGSARPAAAGPSETAPSEPRGTDRLIGRSPKLLEARDAIRRLAALATPVLITGETGTGKELAARAIHDLGASPEAPFIAVNCGAIARSLLESELFGHERGAFTGAERAHRGIFEAAGEGTVLLDEIGDMPAELQVALLRVLETGEVRPVGSARSRKVSCRILAATNAPLESLAAEDRFRPDLLYRLQRLEIRLAPLRERPEDILPLAEHFLSEGRRDGLRPAMAREVQEWLLGQKWPGNVRELRNVIERLRLLNSEKMVYGPEDLASLRPGGEDGKARNGPPANPEASAPPAQAVAAGLPEPADRAEVERFLRSRRTPLRRLDLVRDLFRQHGKLTRAELAGILGTSPFTVGRDLKRLLAEGLIEKVRPTAAARTHYFRLKN